MVCIITALPLQLFGRRFDRASCCLTKDAALLINSPMQNPQPTNKDPVATKNNSCHNHLHTAIGWGFGGRNHQLTIWNEKDFMFRCFAM
jgi:hypothetical protein